VNLIAPCVCVATALLSMCDAPPSGPADVNPVFCNSNMRQMIFKVVDTNSPDKDTQAIKADAEALARNLQDHRAGGGPSSPENVTSFQRFRAFVKKKCNGKDIGRSLTGS
jgi:hypothetical protein